jgi:hypothetical protein
LRNFDRIHTIKMWAEFAKMQPIFAGIESGPFEGLSGHKQNQGDRAREQPGEEQTVQ